jgi:hypothetical protein
LLAQIFLFYSLISMDIILLIGYSIFCQLFNLNHLVVLPQAKLPLIVHCPSSIVHYKMSIEIFMALYIKVGYNEN